MMFFKCDICNKEFKQELGTRPDKLKKLTLKANDKILDSIDSCLECNQKLHMLFKDKGSFATIFRDLLKEKN